MLANTELNAAGWTFLLVSTIAVTYLTFWCFRKVLRQPD